MKEINTTAVKEKIAACKKASKGCVERMKELRESFTSVTESTDEDGNVSEYRVWTDNNQRYNSYELNNIRLAYDAKAFELESLLSTYQHCRDRIDELMSSNTEIVHSMDSPLPFIH